LNFNHFKIFYSIVGLKKPFNKNGCLPFLCQLFKYGSIIVIFFLSTLSVHAQTTDTRIVKTIVLDPGHGGKDPGNLGTKRYKTTEKDIALAISLLVGDYLKQAFPNMKVLYTRNDDSFPELNERTEFANKNKADLFVSIHCNANENKRPVGADTWVMGPHKNDANLRVAQKENASIYLEKDYKQKYGDFDPNSPETYLALSLRQNVHLNESLMLAKYVQDEFRTRVGRVDRGVKQSGFYVISFTTMPSVLVETGFLTNPDEEDFLNSKKGQEYMASAIYRAIKKYISEVENIPVSQLLTVGTTENKKDSLIINPVEIIGSAIEQMEENLESKKETNIIPTDVINYRIQLFVSSVKKEINSENFNGLDNISVITVGNLYKYYFSKVYSYQDAKKMRKTAQKNGYDEAFIVSFKGESRIDLQEALTLEREN
jgi:N-acetylmuramoyl-L-alanine amidase